MKINIMKKGDKFVGLYGNLIAIEKPSGEVEMTEIILEDGLIRIGEKPKIHIGYGDGVIQVSSKNGNIEVATF